jgi:hypothetical protein
VKHHLYRLHQDKLTKKQRGELVKFADSLDLAHPDNVKIPKREDGPVPFLYKEEGFECARCGYCCPMESSMMEHGRRAHKDAKNESKRVWIQVFICSIEADISRHSSYQISLSNISLSTSSNLLVVLQKSVLKHCSNERH